MDVVSSSAVGGGTSDSNGYFKICNLPPDNYRVGASKDGYDLVSFEYVTVIARAPCDQCEQATIWLEPIQANQPPVSQLDARPCPTIVEAGQRVEFDGSRSSDPDGQVVGYNFDFGDGSTSGWISSSFVTHSYSTRGIYEARLQVRDNSGLVSDWTDADMCHGGVLVVGSEIALRGVVTQMYDECIEVQIEEILSGTRPGCGDLIRVGRVEGNDIINPAPHLRPKDCVEVKGAYYTEEGVCALLLTSPEHYVQQIPCGGETEGPDLVVEDIEWRPTNPTEQDTLGLYIKLWNKGAQDAGRFYVSLQVDGQSLTERRLDGLPSGKRTTLMISEGSNDWSWKHDCEVVHTLKAIADAHHEIAESDETNNSIEKTLRIECAEPSGSFTAISFTALCIDRGEWENHIRCTLRYQNDLGEQALVVFIFKNASTGEVIGEARPYGLEGSSEVGALFPCPPGESGTYRFSWKAYKASDTHEEHAVAWCEPADEVTAVCPCASADEIAIIEGETDAMGEFTFAANGDIVRVTVVDENSNPVSGNHIRAIHTGKNVIVHTYDPDGSYFPGFGFKSLSTSSSNPSEFTVDPKIAPVIVVGIAVVGIALTAHELITDPPGHFEVLRDDDLELKCMVGDINDVLAVASAICTGYHMLSTASGTIHATSSAVEALGWGSGAVTVFGAVQLVTSQVTDAFRPLDEDHSFCWLETWDGEKVAGPYIDNWPPTARFEACGTLNEHQQCYLTPVSEGILSDKEVEFNAEWTEDTNDGIDNLLFNWEFGDGATDENRPDPEVSHVYQKAGTYKVELTVRDPRGAEDRESMRIRIEIGDETPAPVACFNATPTSGEAPLTVDFDSSCSSGEIDAYSWEFGDGGTSSSQNPSHVYDRAGTFTARLTVSGPGGEDSSAETINVQEQNQPPVLSDGRVTPPSGYADQSVFTYTVVYQDDDGDEPSSPANRHVWIRGYDGTSMHVDMSLPMTRVSGDISTGATYSASTTLPDAEDGFYTFGFYFAYKVDGKIHSAVSDQFDGPVVMGGLVTITSTGPVNLQVTDPDGLVVTMDTTQIPGAEYAMEDLDGDGDRDVRITIPNRKPGEYEVAVVPTPDAKPTDGYTVEVSSPEAISLTDSGRIEDLPQEPYAVEVLKQEPRRLTSGQNMISFGLMPEDASPGAIFDEIHGPLDLRRWNSTAGRWDTVADGKLPELDPLGGYYIWVPKDVSIVVEGLPLNGDRALTLEKAGWQQIGVPYGVAWGIGAGGTITVARGGVEKSLAGAVEAGWIHGTASAWNAEEQEWVEVTGETGGTLDPWTGYWIYTFVDDVTLHFSQEPSLGQVLLSSGATRPAGRFPTVDEDDHWDLEPSLQWSSVRVINAPNPVRDVDTTTFMVKGICPCLVSGLMVSVYGLDGRLVWEGRTTGSELEWHTESADGQWVANGMYIYVAQVNVDGQWIPVDPGKLAVLR